MKPILDSKGNSPQHCDCTVSDEGWIEHWICLQSVLFRCRSNDPHGYTGITFIGTVTSASCVTWLPDRVTDEHTGADILTGRRQRQMPMTSATTSLLLIYLHSVLPYLEHDHSIVYIQNHSVTKSTLIRLIPRARHQVTGSILLPPQTLAATSF
jgi:hypothetical protein